MEAVHKFSPDERVSPVMLPSETKVAVIGLGYVGLPLALGVARHFNVVGFDINKKRVGELNDGVDHTGEATGAALKSSTALLTAEADKLKGIEIFIVTVPTPVDDKNVPDLSPVRSACKMVGKYISKGSVVVFESTVYPGVTEDICGPLLEEISGLTCGKDFFLGYSPERINPGDREHTVDRITKVIAGQTPEVTEKLAALYGAVTTGGVFRARNIKTAEAAKVIENSQRDINIAFVNEITMIFQKLGISVFDVLDAAGSKWNFLKFSPGLVGGHCIGVDPFYLAHRAIEVGHNPEVILAGRKINDSFGDFIAESVASQLDPGSRVLILGLTFKEDVPDLRNSKVIDVIRGLEKRGCTVDVHDPLADIDEAKHEYGVTLLRRLSDIGSAGDGREPDKRKAQAGDRYDCVVGAVSHKAYREFPRAGLNHLLKPGGLLADIKGMWRNVDLPKTIRRWQP
jgi:UDP-N-acetyl-D-glucosamine/UDP-N-acetyl-D-galactosamine dehydrogenase